MHVIFTDKEGWRCRLSYTHLLIQVSISLSSGCLSLAQLAGLDYCLMDHPQVDGWFILFTAWLQ